MTTPETADDVRATLARMRAETPPAPGPRCSIERLSVRLLAEDEQVAAVVWDACDDATISPGLLAPYLAEKFGAKVSAYTIRRHRRRLVTTADTCRCPR